MRNVLALRRSWAQTNKMLVFAYLLLIHVAIGFLIVERTFEHTPPSNWNHSDVSVGHYRLMLVFHRWIDPLVPSQSIIFLGDSITEGLATTAVAPMSVNYGIGGETTSQLLSALPIYKSLLRARLIVLTIGINDLVHGHKAGLAQRYHQIAAKIPSGTPLLWVGVMPVKIASGMSVESADIDRANQTIQLLCLQRGNCTYLDTAPLFSEGNGNIRQDLYLPDGIHLNSSGYRQWIRALKLAANKYIG